MSEFKIIKLFQTFAEIAAIEKVAVATVAVRRHAGRLIFDLCLDVCVLSSVYVTNLLNGEIIFICALVMYILYFNFTLFFFLAGYSS